MTFTFHGLTLQVDVRDGDPEWDTLSALVKHGHYIADLPATFMEWLYSTYESELEAALWDQNPR